jgi:hypothetical protein
VTISARSDDGFSSTLSGSEGSVQQLNDQIFQVVAIEGRRAVLALRKR